MHLTPDAKTDGEAKNDRLWSWVLLVCSTLTIWPVLQWVVEQSTDHQQLWHALIVLGMAVLLLVSEKKRNWAYRWQLGRWSMASLGGGLVVLALHYFQPSDLLLLLATSGILCGVGLFVLGDEKRSVVYTFGAVFYLYAILVMKLPDFDYPLRHWAGQYAAWLLQWTGREVRLEWVAQGNQLELMLLYAGRVFRVAAECNGFGLISASLLLGLLLALYRKIAWLDKGLLLACGCILAFAGNVTRIVVIILLAPWAGSRYFLMHEIVGTIFYYGVLLLLWWISAGYEGQKGKRSDTPTQA